MIKQVSTSRRHWTQFSLRTLLTIMLVVAAFLAGRTSVQPELKRLREAEREAIGQCTHERVEREEMQGALMVAEERLMAMGASLSAAVTKIQDLQKELARQELPPR